MFFQEAIFSRYHTSKIDRGMLMLSSQCPGSNWCFTALLGPKGTVPGCPYCETERDLALVKIFIFSTFKPNLDIYSSLPCVKKIPFKSMMCNIIDAAVPAKSPRSTRNLTFQTCNRFYLLPAFMTFMVNKYCII